jgi:hypothetical protein
MAGVWILIPLAPGFDRIDQRLLLGGGEVDIFNLEVKLNVSHN